MKNLYKRFNINANTDSAQTIFKNKINNMLFHSSGFSLTEKEDTDIAWQLCNELGLDFGFYDSVERCVDSGGSFEGYLMKIQCVVNIVFHIDKEGKHDFLTDSIEMAIEDSPVNLGIRVKRYKDKAAQIQLSGSRLLDEKLVDDAIGVLGGEQKSGIRKAFEKGLKEFLEARKDPAKYKNAVRDMQLACDETIKFLFKDKNLGLKHLFKDDRWKRIGLNEYQKQIVFTLNEYIDKLAKHKADSEFSFEDAEAIIYLTGIFIRMTVLKFEHAK